MTARLSLPFASTALLFTLCLPALAATQSSGNVTEICGDGVCAMRFGDDDLTTLLIRVSGDDDDEGDRVPRGHEDECDDDHGEGTDCGAVSGKGNAAPAGTVAPPANGLFGSGPPPVAVTN